MVKEIEIWGVRIQYNYQNVRILDSYKVKEEKDIIQILKQFKLKTRYKSKRKFKSWIKEWKAHNRLYEMNLFIEHTRDCDLEENEKWWRLLAYQILGI